MEVRITRNEDIQGKITGMKHIKIYEIGVYELVIKTYDGFEMSEMRIVKKNELDYGEYIPYIYVRITDINGDIDPIIEMQTTSYGSLNKKECNKFLEAMNYAMDVIAEVEKIIAADDSIIKETASAVFFLCLNKKIHIIYDKNFVEERREI